MMTPRMLNPGEQSDRKAGNRIAVVIPCFNEEVTIAEWSSNFAANFRTR